MSIREIALRKKLLDLAQYASEGPQSPMVDDMIALMREAADLLPRESPRCERFITAGLDDPKYYADLCAKCGEFKKDHVARESPRPPQDATAAGADGN